MAARGITAFGDRQGVGDRALAIGVGALALASAGLLLWLAGDRIVAAAFAATGLSGAGLMLLYRRLYPVMSTPIAPSDWSLVRAIADHDGAAVAITDRAGRLVCANDRYQQWFGGLPTPPGVPLDRVGAGQLAAAGRAAWRDGMAQAPGLRRDMLVLDAEVSRVGRAEDHLLWRFAIPGGIDIVQQTRDMISGEAGQRAGEAGVMTVLIGGEGRIRSANRAFVARATGRADLPIEGREFVTFLQTDAQSTPRFVHEGLAGPPLRLFQFPLDTGHADGPILVVLIDDDSAPAGGERASGVQLQTLLAMLPLGLALADRDGRFLFLNDAFARAAGVPQGATPVYPGDLVVREDKAAVADSVRRFANGKPMSGDIAVRLRDHPDDPVALTIAGARGLGDAAVLLSLKDNSEESRLKREVAQATKMQAVGQLAGGVAHDFNNILTAIIGHCDLMLMRHTPGDSDYDDIQQIRLNSNRAAGLTRQLLAFSRQQTLRPQILQLPDVVSEVSNLLQRLLGETVTLVIKHGRNLGAVRADPGQLEQVIVNLAVNARDAMQAKGPSGGTLTLQTYDFPSSEARKLGSDVLPVADYTALRLTDTGTGIPPDILPSIFDPFFTTKEVGKGTGLGLSTVYGIVKQSGGFIFAESEPGQGASFVIYLPVHLIETQPAEKSEKREKKGELWGSGTILLVEDEDMVRAVAERALTRHGYRVLTARHGEEALEILKQGAEVDMMVSDVVMPTMDGPTMVRQARQTWPDLPILFMSGYAEEQLRRSIDLDHIAFLPKPFSVQQLAEAVRDVLASR